jgi:pSer/pThr/pTyr-binding forkhead associated (FHA) protein
VAGGEAATIAAGASGFDADAPPAALERSDRPGHTEPLTADRVMIGRSSTADIRVDDSRVSRSHLCLERSGRRWTATDQGSSNGSWANGAQMSSGMPRLLRDGDELTIGPVTFTFHAGDAGGSGGSGSGSADAATRVLGDENRRTP